MMTYDCDTTRDLLPLLALGRLSSDEAAAAAAHVDACDDCAEELTVVTLLQRGLSDVPAGLEARVVKAVRTALPQRRWNPARLAMAATVAAAVIGGTVVFERAGYLDLSETPVSQTVSLETGSSAVSWDTEHDPLLHGGSTLQELSVEELELILAEMGS